MINDRVLAIGIISIVLAIIMFPAPIYHLVVENGINGVQSILGVSEIDLKISNISHVMKENPEIVENIEKHPEVIKALKNDNYSAIIVEKPVYITVTPTPDGINYFAGQFSNGTRKLNRPFTIYRSNEILDGVNNINQNSTLEISTVVYDYLLTNNFHYFNPEITNSPSGDGYILEEPKDNQSQFLFIFVGIYTNGDVSTVKKVWLPNSSSFAIQIGNTLYFEKTDFPKQARIAELENKRNINKNSYAQAYGQYRQYIGKFSVDKDFSSSTYGSYTQNGLAGEVSTPDYYIPVGDSNIEDGYIVFEIPKSATTKDIDILFRFFNFGYSDWKLIA